MSEFKWYRISFHDTAMSFDSIPLSENKTLPDVMCEELYKAALNLLLPTKKDLVDILITMKTKQVIQSMMLLSDSPILGLGISRCSFLFPHDVYIPSKYDLELGSIAGTLSDKMLSHNNCTFVVNVTIKLGVSRLSSEEVPTVQKFNPKKFIGLMDGSTKASKVKSP
ncbi:TPA_asm: M [Conopholis alphacytorhabdovirus 1]|nr:TPA_asm: M [Conopholis alphacytorhabdovirus 1]